MHDNVNKLREVTDDCPRGQENSVSLDLASHEELKDGTQHDKRISRFRQRTCGGDATAGIAYQMMTERSASSCKLRQIPRMKEAEFPRTDSKTPRIELTMTAISPSK